VTVSFSRSSLPNGIS